MQQITLQIDYHRPTLTFCPLVCCMQSGNVPGLVQRLLLLEAVQQPVAWSFLNPNLCSIWQQQQHLDLALAACDSSSSSNGMDVARPISSSTSGWLPQLAAALLQPLMLQTAPTGHAGAASQVCNVLWPEPGIHGAVAAAAEAAAIAQYPGSTASYALACLSDAACRCSLACWVLTWHGCMLQQGGDYGSVTSR
jgi:hypothetical protein